MKTSSSTHPPGKRSGSIKRLPRRQANIVPRCDRSNAPFGPSRAPTMTTTLGGPFYSTQKTFNGANLIELLAGHLQIKITIMLDRITMGIE